MIIVFFRSIYLVIFLGIVLGYYSVSTSSFIEYFYDAAILSAQLAILILVIVVFPGILRRFGYSNILTRSVMLFRRQLGILVYGLAFYHASIIILFPIISGGSRLILPLPLFQAMGLAALFIFTALFLTSNNWMLIKLGVYWKRIHRFIYLALWFVFLHVALISDGIFPWLIGITAIIETSSLIYFYVIKRFLPPSKAITSHS